MEDARVSLVGKGQQRSRAGLWSPKTRVRGSMSRAATAIIYKNLRKSLFAVSIFPGQAQSQHFLRSFFNSIKKIPLVGGKIMLVILW